MNTILALGIISIASIVIAKIVNKIKLPSVTGYLLAGLLIGPSVLGIIGKDITSQLSFLSDLALGLIAFHIGENFEVKTIKRLGKSVLSITFFEAFIAVVFVFIALFLYTRRFAFSIVVASIAAATAPAATLMVIKEYKARGPLTDTLISVVAMDDLVCILLYSIASAIAQVATSGEVTVFTALVLPLLQIIGAFAIGGAIGFIITYLFRKNINQEMLNLLPMTFVLLAVGISNLLGLSSLLTCLAIGAVVANFSSNSHKIFDSTENLSTHIYMLFFTLSGMSLDLSIVVKLGIPGLIYIVSRSAGKFTGAYFGGAITHVDKKINSHLGFGLFPQAGVAIGLATLSASKFVDMGPEILNLIMGSVFIYELVGPVISKRMLIHAGEAQEKK